MPETTVTVKPEVVLMAIRYGLPRATYAHSDAVLLAVAHAAVLRRWADTLIPDIRATEDPALDTLFRCADGWCLQNHRTAIAALTDHTDGSQPS